MRSSGFELIGINFCRSSRREEEATGELQANKNALNEALKTSAGKDSHKVILQVMIPVEKADQDALDADDFIDTVSEGLTA